jgi:DNA-binding transcriptional LysR family regulator
MDEGADLVAGGFDLLMQVGPLQDSSFVVTHLGTIPIVLAATPAYLDAHGRPKAPADLARHHCIRKLGSEPERKWTLSNRLGHRSEASIGGTFECSDSQLQRDVLYAGYGIGPLPASEVQQAERTGRLERVLPSWAFDPVPVWVLSPRGRLRLPRIALVVDQLKRVVANHTHGTPPS